MKKYMKLSIVLLIIAVTALILVACSFNNNNGGNKTVEEKYTVTFDVNGGAGNNSTASVAKGGKATLPAAPTREGFDFGGWFSDKDVWATAFTADTVVNKDITVYAKWTEKASAVTKYSFGVSAGENGTIGGTAAGTYASGTSITVSASPLTGFAFDGWFSGDTKVSSDASFTFTISENTTYQARFKAIEFTVEYNSDDIVNGTVVPSATTAVYGGTITYTVTPSVGYDAKVSVDGGEAVVITGSTYVLSEIKGNKTLSFTFERKIFTVTFKDYDGTVLAERTGVLYGTAATAPVVTENREAYVFDAWDKDYSNVQSNLIINARYKIKVFDVAFMDGEASLSEQSVDYGSYAAVPTTPSKVGYVFEGWYGNSNLTSRFLFSTKITAETTIYAKWTDASAESFRVIFKDKNGAQIGNVQYVEGNGRASVPAAPAVPGFSFDGWDENSDGSVDVSVDESSVAITQAITFNAIYSPISYTVTFVADGAETAGMHVVPAQQRVFHGDYLMPPTTPKRAEDGFELAYWTLDGEVFDFQSAVEDNIELIGVWREESTTGQRVLFYREESGITADPEADIINGATFGGMQLVPTGEEPITPKVPEIFGKSFFGWRKNGEALPASSMEIGGNAVKFIAFYADNAYTVTFMDYDGTEIQVKEDVLHGTDLTSEAPTVPSRMGYDFASWDKDITNVTSSLIVYATYTEKSYNVYFKDANDVLFADIVLFDSHVTIPTTPEKAGFSFIGWYTSGEYTTEFDFSTYTHTRTENLNIFAKFEAAAATHTVTFLSDGNSVSVQTVADGNSAIKPANPTKKGYTFVSWDKSFSDITADTDVSAVFSAIVYTVSFYQEDGTTKISDVQVNYGATATAPTAPEKDNYTFFGWNKSIENVTASFSTKAIYKNNVVAVTFYDGSTAYTALTPQRPQLVEIGAYASIPATPARAGYSFKGWYTTDTFTTEFGFNSTAISTATSVYAKWERNSQKEVIILDAKGGNVISTQYVTSGNTAIEPCIGNLTGWKNNANDSAFDFTTPVTADVTVYAVVSAPGNAAPKNLLP